MKIEKRQKKRLKKELLTGNDAVGTAAIKAGCEFYAGYPITPQNELTAFMALHMKLNKKIFIQAESEIAAINMVYGASAAGARCMTSSSSPGISLKQEGISYLAGAELPAVIVNVMRAGPGLGDITPAQSDYFQAVKGGGHGDYRIIVLAPFSVQECFDLTRKAFDLADKYRIQVMVLTDAFVGQMAEAAYIKNDITSRRIKKDWALTGAKKRKQNIVRSLFLGPGILEAHNLKLQKKYKEIQARERLYKTYKCKDAEFIFVAYGISARIAKGVVASLRKQGFKAGLFRPVSLWPYPDRELKKVSSGKKGVFVCELSYGQMLEDVRQALSKESVPVYFYGRAGGGVFTEKELIKVFKAKIKRVK
jgi:2-oxoglutarate/2-oxoacid ferredoxin oxidoreductase subunit alpha